MAMIEKLKSNVSAIRERIAGAAKVSGRAAADVCLVAVTKYVDIDTTRALAEAGCVDLGESRPQSLWGKTAALRDLSVRWHMIGHLQRNKVKRTIECCDLIHSVDSQRLLNSINSAAQDFSRVVEVLVEVNVSGESAKHGLAPDELPAMLEFAGTLEHVSVTGLMCMAGLTGGLDEARREFAMLRELRAKLEPTTPGNVHLTELSMGMSGDFEVAIEEGATLVRVGSLLFEGIEK